MCGSGQGTGTRATSTRPAQTPTQQGPAPAPFGQDEGGAGATFPCKSGFRFALGGFQLSMGPTWASVSRGPGSSESAQYLDAVT
jgi:hypothetical protein